MNHSVHAFPRGSGREWLRYFAECPGSQDLAFNAVLDVSRAIDERFGSTVLQNFWQNLYAGNYIPVRALP